MKEQESPVLLTDHCIIRREDKSSVEVDEQQTIIQRSIYNGTPAGNDPKLKFVFVMNDEYNGQDGKFSGEETVLDTNPISE